MAFLEKVQMNPSKKSQHPCSNNRKTDNNKKSRLCCLVLKHGNLQILNAEGDLPQSLIKANDAIAAGRIEEATRLVNDEAIDAVQELLEKDPSRTDVMFVLAAVLRQTKQTGKAKQWYEKILKEEPHPLVYNELAYISESMGSLSEALQYQRKAVKADPTKAELLANLARILIKTGKTQEGIDLFRKAVEKEPSNTAIHSNLLFYLHFLPSLHPQTLFEEHKRWGQMHAPANIAKKFHNNTPDPDRRLRVGYISPDFGIHPVTYFFEPLLDGHNHQEVELYGYGNVRIPSNVTERLKSKFDHYRNIFGVSDKAVVRLLEQDKIDILVELAGHTADNRLLVLAHKPAPIQVTYLGSPDTTGMQAIDYRLTDELAEPPQPQKFYTEELVFLPEGFLCYRPRDLTTPVTSLPALRKGYVTFGSFNSSCKIHPHIMTLWAEILKTNSDWRLLVKFGESNDQQMRENYFRRFEKLGIARQRVAIYGWRPADEHFQLYGQIDIALDTYPFNGFTTTCETLWMGVPIISLVGECHASRVGLSILSQAGLEFFAASTPNEYVAKARALAGKLQALEKIRASMRERMIRTGLCDPKRFAPQVETAYRKMWHRWCRCRSEICI